MQNLLNNTKCYLAGNLEFTEDAENWRNRLSQKLLEFGVVSLDPTKQMFLGQEAETEEIRLAFKEMRVNEEFGNLHEKMKEIIRRDLRAVDLSTFTIFKLEPSRPTFGTIHELVVASTQRKPILILIKSRKEMPLWLIGLVNMDFVFEDEDALFEYLRHINDGTIPLDTKYWKILVEK